MKKPRKPPIIKNIEKDLNSRLFAAALYEGRKSEAEGRYRHWDILRHLTPPVGLTNEQWWFGIKMCRQVIMQPIPLKDKENHPFSFSIPDGILEQLHEIDLRAGGTIGAPEEIVNPHTRTQYLMRSLIQEAITSSQLEGAATTRVVAKEMLKSGREPRDKNEWMILNNFHTMQRIREWKDRPLDENLLFEIHRQVTDQTLENPDAAGRFRKTSEPICIHDISTNEVLYTPPDARELPKRVQQLCDFANGKKSESFIHPVIRAMILHFWIAYDHPFVDGNGRTARAIFYWSMLRQGYWLFEYISISEIILAAPVQYGMAFLFTETDDNDLTYFLLYHTNIIKKSIRLLDRYIQKKSKEIRDVGKLFKVKALFNPRQQALLSHALKHPGTIYTIAIHQMMHHVAYDTARKDLLDLRKRNLLESRKKGKEIVFIPTKKMAERIRKEGRK